MPFKCMQIVDVVEKDVVKAITVFVKTIEEVCEKVVKEIEEWEKQTKNVCEKVKKQVCKWLPWPANKLCNWVTETVCKVVEILVKVTKTIVETVCVLVTTFTKLVLFFIEKVLVLVLRLVCFWVDFISNWVEIITAAVAGILEFLTCMLGLGVRKHLHICVTVLANSDGVPVVDPKQVAEVLREARRIIGRRMNVSLHVLGEKTVRVSDDVLDVTACNAGQLFSGDAVDLSSESSGSFADLLGCGDSLVDVAEGFVHNVLDVIFIRDIIEGDDVGCHIPGTDYVIIDQSATGLVLAHEIGHACDLWHVSGKNNLMNHNTADDQVKKWQRCIFRRARFVSFIP